MEKINSTCLNKQGPDYVLDANVEGFPVNNGQKHQSGRLKMHMAHMLALIPRSYIFGHQKNR